VLRALLTAVVLVSLGAAPAEAHEGHCADPPAAVLAAPGLRLVELARLDAPVHAIPYRGGLLVAERAGRVRVLRDGRVAQRPLLDLRPAIARTLRTTPEVPNERGLFSLARKGARLFAFYSGRRGDLRIDEFRMDGERARRVRNVLLLEHSDARVHYGGQLAFGPDGELYASTGERTRRDSAQRETPYGKLLRLDPRRPGDYEIVARGLRNPFRFSFDGREIALTDVGEHAYEEVNLLRLGGDRQPNFGWPIFEGPRRERPDRIAHRAPALSLAHGDGWNALTGGYVVRAHDAALRGRYLFGDFCEGTLWSALLDRPARDARPSGLVVPRLSGIVPDRRGRPIALSLQGAVYRLVRAR
jgi:glucose/arabinose dehydrogenase